MKILFTSPNFFNLFGFNQSKISNYIIIDNMPIIILIYHNYLIDNSVKYSIFQKYLKNQLMI